MADGEREIGSSHLCPSRIVQRRGRCAVVLVATVVGLLASACEAGQDVVGPSEGGAPTSASGQAVVVDIFSGVENPTFRLSPAASAALDEGLTGMSPDLDADVFPATGLGFRGFVVDTPGAEYRLLPDVAYRVEPDGTVSSTTERADEVYAVVWDDIAGQFDPAWGEEVTAPQE